MSRLNKSIDQVQPSSLAIEIAAIQTKPASTGSRNWKNLQSAKADFVCIAANSIRQGIPKLPVIQSIYLLPFLLLTSPVLAHNVKTEGNVASTFHIEPNHNPKAGEASQAWFALTKPGGEVISLDRCNCQLKVTAKNQIIKQPQLKAISAEQYKGIPGADITFPNAGIYTLEISGSPKTGDDFNAFKFAYDVTVQAGAAQQSSPVAQVPTATQPEQNQTGWILPIALGAIAIAAGAWFVKRTVKN